MTDSPEEEDALETDAHAYHHDHLYQDTDIRVIDQRIGMGIGGWNTVIRLYHKPTGILIEMPRLRRNQFLDKKLAFEMLEYAIIETNGDINDKNS
jgi:protein subunit release factor A